MLLATFNLRMFTYLTLALNLCIMCTSLSLLLIGTWSKHNDNSPSLQCLIFVFCLLSHWKIFTLLPYRSLSLLRGRTFSRGTSRLCNRCPGRRRNNGAVGRVFITATVKVLPKFFDVGGSEICSLNSTEMTTATTLIWKECEAMKEWDSGTGSSWSLKKGSHCFCSFSH